MPLTDFAAQLVDAREAAEIADRKATYAARIRRIQHAVKPPLKSRELSVGLGLQDERAGGSVIGRFLSEAPRNRRARPDTRTRALIDALLDGSLFLAVQASLPGAPRTVLVVDARDVPRMDRTWTVLNLAGHPIPDRHARAETWDDGDVFDLFEEDRPRHAAWASRQVVGRDVGVIGLGTLRLSSDPDRPERERALATLHAALDAGVRLIDTADSYGLDDEDLHHGERLIREALERWEGEAEQVLVVTKAGLARPAGRWVPRGDPEHLTRAVHASREALGMEVLPLVLLHAVDPRIALEESLGALFALREEGVIGEVGVCNVDRRDLARAQAVGPIAALQVELSALTPGALGPDGPVRLARVSGIPVLAHRPLGGWKRGGRLAQDATLRRVADRRRASPEATALAWLVSLSPGIVPLVGATRPPTARDSAQAARLALSDEDRSALDAAFGTADDRRALRELDPPDEVVILLGPPAAGKTSRVQPYLDRGYLRLNRDERGGSLDDLLAPLDAALRDGTRRVVLDNTYPTRRSRAGVIEVASRHGLPVRAVFLDTPERDALLNACHRMVDKTGEVLSPEALAAHPDPNLLPPAAVHAWFQRAEPPSPDEGFASIERVPFERRHDPEATTPGLILDLDGTLRRSTGGAPFPRTAREVALLPGRTERLRAFVDAGVVLTGLTNQAGVGLGQLTLDDMQAAVARTAELLDLPIDITACPHRPKAGCWCRKPRPGLGVLLMRRHALDPRRTWMIGDRHPDRGVAEALGIPFVHADVFFSEGGPSLQTLLDGDEPGGAG